MRSRWSDVADEVPPRTAEDDERALARARVFVGFEYGRGGRCPNCNVKPHPQARTCCGRELR